MLRCECCGGTINRFTMKCDFCDTEYIFNDCQELQIKICNKPTKKFMSKMILPKHVVEEIPNTYIKERLAGSLVDKIIEEMDIKTRYNPCSMSYEIYGMIEIASEG